MIRQVALLAVLAATARAGPPPPGSEDAAIMNDFRNWVIDQHAATGEWCCDLSDGRPLRETELRVNEGAYQIYYSRQHWEDGTDQWITVPAAALLHVPNPMGVPIAWVLRGHVYCLSLSGAI